MGLLKFALITPIFLIFSHYLAVFPHEYAHSFMAWILGVKANPLNLEYGGTGLYNLLLLGHIDENVDYSMIFASGHPAYAAVIAFAGAGIANGSLFAISYFLLKKKSIQQIPSLFYFLFLFNLMNLGNFYDYVPIRTFADFDDVHNFVRGFAISPWWVYAVGGYIVAFLIWQFFRKTMIAACLHLQLVEMAQKASLMIVCVCILFGYFGGFPHVYFLGQEAVGEITYFLCATSWLAIPGLIFALWPTRG